MDGVATTMRRFPTRLSGGTVGATETTGAILCGCAVNFFIDVSGTKEATCCASHGLTAVHWACAAFLAVMMVYNLVRPVGMSHAKHK